MLVARPACGVSPAGSSPGYLITDEVKWMISAGQ